MSKTFSLAKGIEESLLTFGEISFSMQDVQITFTTWEDLSVAQKAGITAEMNARGYRAID